MANYQSKLSYRHEPESLEDIMKRVYRNELPALRAARRKLGGTIMTYDGQPVIAIAYRNDYDQVQADYLSAEDACEKADIIYAPAEF